MFDASTEIAGLMIRSKTRPATAQFLGDVKVMSTPRTVVTGRSTFPPRCPAGTCSCPSGPCTAPVCERAGVADLRAGLPGTTSRIDG